jgi:hypothetical protein
MNVFVKSALFAALGVCTLAMGSGAQPPNPPPAPVPPPPVDPFGQPPHTTTIVRTADGVTNTVTLVEPQIHGLHQLYGHFDQADTQVVQLAKQIVEAKADAEKDKLKDKLKETLNKQFDDRQKRHEKELEALEAQVKKLKEMVSKRQENKKEIIEERTKQLEREAKGLGW